jgi:hypothetical protein
MARHDYLSDKAANYKLMSDIKNSAVSFVEVGAVLADAPWPIKKLAAT